MEGKTQGLLGGLSGAALLALLFAGQGKVASNTPAYSAPVGNTRPANATSLETQGASLDQNGPWSAVCEEFLSGLDEHLPAPVVSFDTVPKGAVPGATEVNIRKGDFESKVPVRNYPVNPNLTVCLGKQQNVRAIIAMVPDPVRSHMQLEFDRSVAGIVRGAGADDFSLQRYWFPWTPNSAMREQSTETEYQGRLRLNQPAVLIFRHTEVDEDERLLIFLVGETPTAGVNREQFSIALKYARQLQRADDSQIRIAGPRFSASLPILEELIKASIPSAKSIVAGDTATYRNFSVYSPSTTNDVLMKRFVNDLPGIDFLTFQVRDNDTLKQLVTILRRMSYHDEEIATLSEDESAYGVGQEPEEGDTSATNPPAHKINIPQDGDDTVPPPQLLRLQFPRDLSSVRNAIEEQNPQLEASRELGIPILSVPLSLHEEPQNEHDSPPPYATAQAAADLDRELQSLVGRIRENNIQAVLVMASNPLDRLFLLDYLRTMLPDVRLVTAESDTLMLKRPGYVDLSGTLVLSSVPLLMDSRATVWHQQVIDPAESSAAEFRSTGEESVFLSVWSSLVSGKDEKRVEHPGKISRSCEFLSVVGADRFLLANAHAPEPFFPCTIDRKTIGVVTQHLESFPPSWKVFVLVLALASLVHVLFVNFNVLVVEKQETTVPQHWSLPLRNVVQSAFQKMFRWELYRVVPDPQPGPALTTSIYPKKKSAPDFVAEKLLLLFVLTNQLFLFSYMVFRTTWVAWLPLHAGDRILGFDPVIPQLGMLFLCSLLPATLLVTTTRLFGRLCWRLKFNPKKGLSWQGIVAASFVIWTVITWEYLLHSGTRTPDWGVAYRSMQVFAGLSPLAAIGAVLLGYVGFTLTHLRRVEHIQNRRVYLDFAVDPKAADEASASAKRITGLQDDIHRAIETALSHPALQVMFFVLPCVFLLRVFVALRGIETNAPGTHFSLWSLTFWSILWGFLALLTFIAFTFYQTWSMWTKVRALLQHLNCSPIREVFAGLASDTSSMQIWKIGGDRRSLVLQYRTLELLRRMAVIRSKVVNGPDHILPDQSLQAELDRLEANLYERERCDQTRSWKDHTTTSQISKALNAKLPEAKFLLGRSDASDDQPSDEQASRYLGLRIAALLRYSLIQIRNMLWFGLWGFVFLLLSVRLYPFQGRHTLSMLMSFLFIALLLAIGAMFAQMESDPISAKLQDSDATASGSFLRAASKLVAVGGVPLLAVIASQFPAFAAFISGWIKPISESLR